jgi:tRNA U55 pseudouridine synthase TruB
MSALVRERIGDFALDTAVTVDDLSSRPIDELLLPPLAAVAHLPRHPAGPAESYVLRLGRPIQAASNTSFPAGILIALVDEPGDLLALAEFDAEQFLLRPRQVFVGR